MAFINIKTDFLKNRKQYNPQKVVRNPSDTLVTGLLSLDNTTDISFITEAGLVALYMAEFGNPNDSNGPETTHQFINNYGGENVTYNTPLEANTLNGFEPNLEGEFESQFGNPKDSNGPETTHQFVDNPGSENVTYNTPTAITNTEVVPFQNNLETEYNEGEIGASIPRPDYPFQAPNGVLQAGVDFALRAVKDIVWTAKYLNPLGDNFFDSDGGM